MTKSALQIARAAYQPKLPKALTGAVAVKEGEATQSVADQEAIKKLFPNTYGMPLIQFVEGQAQNTAEMNVGVILSGGQAPGGHNVTLSLVFSTVSRNLILTTNFTDLSLVLAVWLTTTIKNLLLISSTNTATQVVSISSVQVVQNLKKKNSSKKVTKS